MEEDENEECFNGLFLPKSLRVNQRYGIFKVYFYIPTPILYPIYAQLSTFDNFILLRQKPYIFINSCKKYKRKMKYFKIWRSFHENNIL